MQYFGPPGTGAVYQDIEEAPTPLGETCLYPACERNFRDGEQGFILFSLSTGEMPHPIHRDCLLQWIAGPDH